MYDVIGIGSTVYDTLMLIDEYPNEDTKVEGLDTLVQGGGPSATALVAASKLGVSAAYMGTVGDDPFGSFMMNDLEKYGVSTKFVRRVSDCISFHAVVLLSKESGSRTCIWNRGTVQPPTPSDINEQALLNAKILHLDGHMLDAAVYAAQLAKENGVKVSYDAGGLYPEIEKLLPYIDFFIPSEEFALKLTGAASPEEAAKSIYDTYHPEVVVLTQGVKGGIMYQNGMLERYQSFPVEAIDTNGAGDTFHGAFIAGYIKGYSFMQCAVYASAVSAIKCTHFGARQGIPCDAAVHAFLKERGIEL